MKKVKAFTLLELLIGMIIGSIVIAIGYASYNVVYKQYLIYKSYRKELMEFANLNSELQNNFYHSNSITGVDKEITFEFNTNKIVKFTFYDEFILRIENDVIDTFKLNVLNFSFDRLKESTNIVNNITFDSELLNENVNFYFEKTYDSKAMIEAELNSIAE